MSLISKNVYIDKLDDLVNIYNNTCHSATKMKLVELKSDTCIDSSNKNNDEDCKFKIRYFVGISKYKNIFAKGYTPNWSEEVFVIKKVKKLKILCRVHMLLMILKEKKLLELYTKKNWKKQIKKGLEMKN